MGFTDTIRKITNWETAFSIAFCFGAIAGVAITAMAWGHVEIAYACIVALGIPTSFFGSVVNKAKVNGSTKQPISSNEQLYNLEKVVAELSTILVDTKSEVELLKINGEVRKL